MQQLMIPIALHIVRKKTLGRKLHAINLLHFCASIVCSLLTIKKKMNEKIITEVQIVQIQGEHKFFR